MLSKQSKKFSLLLTLISLTHLFSCQLSPESNGQKKMISYQGHGEKSLDTTLLKKFAPPQVADEDLKNINALLDIRSPSYAVADQDAENIYFNWSVTGLNQVWKINRKKNFPQQMTGGKDPSKILDITPNGQWIVLSRDEQGKENPGLYLQKAEGGPLKVIYHQPQINAHFEFISDDSTYLYFRANDKTDKVAAYSFYQYDIKNGSVEKIWEAEGAWSITDHQQNGTLLLKKSKGNMSHEYYEWSPQTKKLTPLLGQDEQEDYQIKYLSKNNRDQFLVLTNKFTDMKTLYHWKRKDHFQLKNLRPLVRGNQFEIDWFYMDRLKEKIFIQKNRQGFGELLALNSKNFQPLPMPNWNKEIYHTFWGDTTQDGKVSLIVAEGGKIFRQNYLYFWREQKLLPWSVGSIPEMQTDQFHTDRLEYYPAQDGSKIPMLVKTPTHCHHQNKSQNKNHKETPPCPVIVHFHGGPEAQSRPGFNAFAEVFLQAGFIYVEPNIRGSTGFGKNYERQDNGRLRKNILSDIADCATYIKTHWKHQGMIPKVGIMGGSYGGYATLMGMSLFAGSYDAGASMVGMSNLVSFLINTASYRQNLRKAEYGDPEKDREELLMMSPISYIERIKDPILLIQGVHDPRVPVGEAYQFYSLLKEKRKSVDLILFPDEGHGIIKKENRALQWVYLLRFFNQYLK